MTDERLDKLIDSASESYRVPPEPRLDEMWRAIDADLGATAAGGGMPRSGAHLSVVAIAATAALVIGVGVGRWSAPQGSASATPEVAAQPAPRLETLAQPLQRTATNYFGATATLLADVQTNPKGAYAARASSLLATTRLLLDSPAAADARLHGLLEDLELILTQVAMLGADESGARRHQDLLTIRNALSDRDVVSRVQTAAVTLASSED